VTEFNKQPDPKLSDESEAVWPKVIEAMKSVRDELQLSRKEMDDLVSIMQKRDQFGIDKYGVPLSTFNGRSPLNDAFEEALDYAVYMSQAFIEANKANLKCRWIIEELEESALRNLAKCYKAIKMMEKE